MNRTVVPARRRVRRRVTGRRPPTPFAARVLRRAIVLALVLVLLVGTASAMVVLVSPAVYAATAGTPLAVDSIEAVVNNIRAWLVGILVAVATLFLTVGGLRLMAANGDPGEAEKGKAALKSAAIGYGLALLAPLIVTIVGDWVK